MCGDCTTVQASTTCSDAELAQGRAAVHLATQHDSQAQGAREDAREYEHSGHRRQAIVQDHPRQVAEPVIDASGNDARRPFGGVPDPCLDADRVTHPDDGDHHQDARHDEAVLQPRRRAHAPLQHDLHRKERGTDIGELLRNTPQRIERARATTSAWPRARHASGCTGIQAGGPSQSDRRCPTTTAR